MDLDDTQEINIFPYNELLKPETLVSELSDQELESVTHEAYERAKELLEGDIDDLHDALHIWRVGMLEHHKRIDSKYEMSRKAHPTNLSD